jgi:2-oxo-4-hydroxy-4-carboxy--5-ureidoimidazoline (OHCU) decarboxylase
MTIFLRNRQNKTIVDIELMKNLDISVSIDIEEYSKLLLEQPGKLEQYKLIKAFSFISELRGWLWEVFYVNSKNKDFGTMKAQISRIVGDIGKDYNLKIMED